MAIILMICGVFWITFSLVIHTKNFISAFCFKAIPFFMGLAVTLCAMDLLGWTNIFG